MSCTVTRRGKLSVVTGLAVATLLALSACTAGDPTGGDATSTGPTGSTTTGSPTTGSAEAVLERSAAQRDPVLVDTGGTRLKEEHAEVVRAVHRALVAGNLDVLGELYAGDDWASQAELLATTLVRQSVLNALGTPPVNLGEGYLYTGASGYQTAFFLDYNPPALTGGALRWRGIATLPVSADQVAG